MKKCLAALAAVLLLTSGCSLLPSNSPSPTEQFQQIIEAAGSDQVVGFSTSRINDSWGVHATIMPGGGPPTRWSYDGTPEPIEDAVPVPARRLTAADFGAIHEALAAQLPENENCTGWAKTNWVIAPSGRELSWLECADGAAPEYLPGSSRIDGQTVPDVFDGGDAASMEQMVDIIGKIYVDGKVVHLSSPNAGVGSALHVIGPVSTLPDGSECGASALMSSTTPRTPLLLTCSHHIDSDQPFDPATFDPAILASVRAQAAAHLGAPESVIQDIGFASPDGVNLSVRLWYNGGQWLTTTIVPR